jgi:hypothetical protein
MHLFSPGDKVSVLNETITGTIIRINYKKCVIEDEDGFERIYTLSNIVLYKPVADYKLSDEKAEKQILSKINSIIKKGQVKSPAKVNKMTYEQDCLEIDLHIEELLEDHSYMSNFDILQRQMQTCRMFIEKAIRLKVKKAVLIHGKGEGVLKNEIYTYLDRLENTRNVKIEFHEASYSTYGPGGATEVRFL